ncbi:MAG TPA: hypothetical protein VGL86_28600 [Polyangia bacterium]
MGFLVTVAVLVSAPPSGGAEARLGEARAAIVAAEKARGVEVLEDPEALVKAGWIGEKHLAFFAEGERLVGDARRALARVELEKAEALLDKAEATYRGHANLPGVRAEWGEAAKWHGVALFELRRRTEALAAWARAKALEPESPLTDAVVRPEVAAVFASVQAAEPSAEPVPMPEGVGRLDAEIVDVAIAVDAGRLTYAGARRDNGCATALVVSTRADELVTRLHSATCDQGTDVIVAEAPVILHPRPAPAIARSGGAAVGERRVAVWRRPWLWVGVVGAIGVGVVLGVSLWPREATYSAGVDFHQFALGAR